MPDGARTAITPLRKEKDEARKESTRQNLLAAAGRAFARRGYHATKISHIVAEAGVGQGTFYRHFQSKRHILECLFDDLLTELLAGFSPLQDDLPRDLPSYKRASLTVVTSLTRVFGQHRDQVLLFLREGPSIDSDFADRVGATVDRFAALASTYLDHAIAAGFARPCDSKLIAQSLVGMGLHLLDRWLSGAIEEDAVEHTVTELVDFAFAGFGLARKGNGHD